LLAKALQCALTQNIGVGLTLFRKVDNSFRDDFVSLVGPVRKSKGYATHFECDAHDAYGLAIKLRTVQKWGYGHDALLSVQAGARLVSRPSAPEL
jgi:hypothetical protein